MGLSSIEYARRMHVQAQTLRAAVCRKGHYFGVVPRRLPNGRLDWPDDESAAPGATTTTTSSVAS